MHFQPSAVRPSFQIQASSEGLGSQAATLKILENSVR